MPDILIEILSTFVTEFLIAIIIIIIAMFLQVILHEGGHLVFGLLTKYKFLSFRIGNIMLLKTDGKLKLKKFSLVGTGGQCIMIPPDFNNGKIPYVLYNAGGAIFNFLSCLFCIILIINYNSNPYYSINPYFVKFAGYFISFGILLGLVNIIPFKGKFITNDGKNILGISKSKNAMESFWRMLKVNALLNEGIRIKDMPTELFVKPNEEDLLNNITVTDGYTYAVRLIDNHKFEEAKDYIEYLLNTDTDLIGIHKSLLKSELIYCYLVIGDFEAIDTLLDKNLLTFFKKAKNLPPILRVQYLLALLKEKDFSKSEEYLKNFEKVAKSYPVVADIEGEYDLIEYAKNKFL